MSKSIKFKNNTYLDTSSIAHNNQPLSDIINSCRKENNGYTKLLNGIILQWGIKTITGITANEQKEDVNFNIAFPNKCFNVQVTLNDVGYGYQRFTTSVGVPTIEKGKFVANFKSTTDKYSSMNVSLYWFAIGY